MVLKSLLAFFAQQGREWDRLLWSGLLHADDMHIYYNMASFLWKARFSSTLTCCARSCAQAPAHFPQAKRLLWKARLCKDMHTAACHAVATVQHMHLQYATLDWSVRVMHPAAVC